MIALWLACTGSLPEDGMTVTDAASVQLAGDLDRDGYDDLVVPLLRTDGVDLLLVTDGLPYDETWAPTTDDRDVAASLPVAGSDSPDVVVVTPGDLDGDYHLDLFIGLCDGGQEACTEHSAVIFGRTDLTELSGPDLTWDQADGGMAQPYALGDIDADGLADVLGGAPSEAPTDLLLGTADRWGSALGPEDLIRFSGETSTLRPVGDTDGDGLGDFVTQGSLCELYWIGGDDDFDDVHASTAEAGVRMADPGWGRLVAGPAGDLDGDGIDDWWLLSTGSDAACEPADPEADLILVQGRSGGPDLAYAGPMAPSDAGAIEGVSGGGDWDGDGSDDLVVLRNSDGRGGWTILPGPDVIFGAPGHLEGVERWEDGPVHGAWWLGDLDDDGGDELAIGVAGYTRVIGDSDSGS